MNALLSRIVDVFDIEGRGCVIIPGIPSSSGIRVLIGDSIQVRHLNGSILDCHVRGIEMIHGPSPDRSMIPLLLDFTLAKGDLPIGSELWIDARINSELHFHIHSATVADFSAVFFRADEKKHIRFGWSAVTLHPASTEGLCKVAFEFRDYIMEGFVSYLVSIAPTSNGVDLSVGLLGMNRDEYVQPQMESYLKEAGFDFT